MIVFGFAQAFRLIDSYPTRPSDTSITTVPFVILDSIGSTISRMRTLKYGWRPRMDTKRSDYPLSEPVAAPCKYSDSSTGGQASLIPW
jgi:hypothetical protein